MKRHISILFTSSVLFALLSVSMIFFICDYDENLIISDGLNWKYKEDEVRSRLLEVPILIYHNIDGKGVFSLDLDVLRSHFQLFKDRNIRIIPLSELINRLENATPLEGKAIVITFDDGYASMFYKLMPLTKEFGYPVTLFVYTDNIRVRATKSLTWKNLREMEKNGITVESHTISHADLLKLFMKKKALSRKRLFEEIYLSKRIIELYLKKRIQYFAFTYGRYNLNIISMCRNSGYRRVFSTDFGSNIITRNNYCLRRHHIKRDYSQKFIEELID